MAKRFEIKREGKKYIVLRADGSIAATALTLRSAKDFVAIENCRSVGCVTHRARGEER